MVLNYKVSFYHNDTNFRGNNPEIFTDLTKNEAKKLFKKFNEVKKQGDEVKLFRRTK